MLHLLISPLPSHNQPLVTTGLLTMFIVFFAFWMARIWIHTVCSLSDWLSLNSMHLRFASLQLDQYVDSVLFFFRILHFHYIVFGFLLIYPGAFCISFIYGFMSSVLKNCQLLSLQILSHPFSLFYPVTPIIDMVYILILFF